MCPSAEARRGRGPGPRQERANERCQWRRSETVHVESKDEPPQEFIYLCRCCRCPFLSGILPFLPTCLFLRVFNLLSPTEETQPMPSWRLRPFLFTSVSSFGIQIICKTTTEASYTSFMLLRCCPPPQQPEAVEENYSSPHLLHMDE